MDEEANSLDSAALLRQAQMLWTAATLAWVGGYLDAVTYLGHGRVFATAMTGNVVLLGVDVVSGSWRQCLTHTLPVLMFLGGILVARAMCHRWGGRRPGTPEFVVLSTEVAVLFGLGWLPLTTPDFVLTMSIALVASMQMATFRNIHGQSFSSTYTSSNLRTMIENAADWLTGWQPKHLRAARDFAAICSMFLLGATIGAFAAPTLHNHALWVPASVLLLLLISLLCLARRPARSRNE